MLEIKVKTPAKINLTLEILGKLPDGFHKIQSIMCAVNLFDYLTFKVYETDGIKITLDGNSDKIPYDERNLVYKAAKLFFEKTKINNRTINIYIEKNIPVEAGLAGGSSDGAGTLFALNKIFKEPLNDFELNELCSQLGSDLNFCLNGGFCLCENRGDIITKLPFIELDVCLIKPKTFGISAKEAYIKYSKIQNKPITDNTTALKNLILQNKFDKNLLINHLELELLKDYSVLNNIKIKENAMLSGSGPTMFCLKKTTDNKYFDDILVIDNLKTVGCGVEII